jgi:DNA-binding CsgD family transcriptional regulator
MVNSTLVGRDAEIAETQAFLSAASGGPAAVVITGAPGIGKTAVLDYLTQTMSRSSRVLSCRPALAERPLGFAALDDLLGDLTEEVLHALPGPRRRAVEFMLLRDPSTPSPSAGEAANSRSLPERRALARGVLDALRVIAADAPLVLAVDDAQWLDHPSAAVLEFCFRRLRSERVSVLLTVRRDHPVPLGLDHALPADRLRRVRLGPLSPVPAGEIAASRFGGLTETERRLAALVAQGLTNRQVASVLFVSENTVQTHVRHIFQKLGVRSRTELAARFHTSSADNRAEMRTAVP